MTDYNEHAVYAPSSADRWMECTASAEAIAQLGEQEEGEEAGQGTGAHNEIERLLGHMNGQIKPERFAMPALNPDHPCAYGVELFIKYVTGLPVGRVWIEQRVMLTKH